MQIPKRFLFALLFLCVLTCCAQNASAPVTPTTPSVRPPPCTNPGQQWISPIDGVTLVCVPAGQFWMGADETDPLALPNEKPRHRVALDAFWIDRTENTNLNFAKCVAAGACAARPRARGTTGVASKRRMNYYYDPEFANYPTLIYQASDAETYCRWAGRRLPTEAEWEKAARGDDLRKFPWGNTLDCERASFSGCTQDTTDVETPPVGASPYGALNMAGNVWEWVNDRYASDYDSNAPAKNPQGLDSGEGNVRRGGGWSSLARDLRVTARASGKAVHYFDGQMGFRCAMDDAAR